MLICYVDWLPNGARDFIISAALPDQLAAIVVRAEPLPLHPGHLTRAIRNMIATEPRGARRDSIVSTVSHVISVLWDGGCYLNGITVSDSIILFLSLMLISALGAYYLLRDRLFVIWILLKSH